MIRKQNISIKPAAMVVAMAAMAAALCSVAGAEAPTRPGDQSRVAASARTADGAIGNRIIVQYKDGTAAARDRAMKLSVVRSALARSSRIAANDGANGGASRYVRRLATGADLIELPAALSRVQLLQVLAQIRADPQVKYAEADAVLQPQMVPDDPGYQPYQWNFYDATGGINLPKAWDISQGAGVVVAVIDTGILPDHPDLAGNLLTGYDFISKAAASRRPSDARVPGALDYGDWVASQECNSLSQARDSTWHGTRVASIIAETTNNGVGLAGAAHKSKILPVRVLGKCGGVTSDLIDAIVWASGGAVDGVPENTDPAEVINLSLYGFVNDFSFCSSGISDAIDSAVSRGAAVVAAAGNGAVDISRRMDCDNLIVVGATDVTGGMAAYSNYGRRVDIAAPGGGTVAAETRHEGYVWTASYNGKTTPASGSYVYAATAGTSMAAAHVSAVAALVQSAVSAAGGTPLTPTAMQALLTKTARPFQSQPPSNKPIGAGIVDAKAALDSVLGKRCVPSQESCSYAVTPLKVRRIEKNMCRKKGEETYYSIATDAGKPLSIMTYGGTGIVSMYVSFWYVPTPIYYDTQSTRPSTNQVVRINNTSGGTYYIRLFGESDYCGTNLLVMQ